MKKKRIAKRWYKIPKTIKDVTLGQFIEFEKYNSKRLELTERQSLSVSTEEQSLLDYLIIDCFDRMVSSISNIPYQTISQLPINGSKKQKIYSWFESVINSMKYNYDTKDTISQFRFKKQRFHLFEFDQLSARQMLFFEAYWKKFYAKTAKEIVDMNFEELPRLIAICAFRKNEVKTILNNGKELPTEIKPEYYSDFSNLVETRKELFKELPLDIVYKCLNFFFVNLMSIQSYTKTSMPQSIMSN